MICSPRRSPSRTIPLRFSAYRWGSMRCNNFGGLFGNWADAHRFRLHSLAIFVLGFSRSATAHYPELRLHAVPFQKRKDAAGLVVQFLWKPPCGQFNPMALQDG